MSSILEVLYSSLVLKELCPIKHRLGISLMYSTCEFLVH